MKMGATPPSYRSTLNPLIIAGGPNSALPHAEVSDRKFMKGDMIVVDLTLRYSGYIADATRTFALVSATSEMKKIYDIVKQSHQAGINAVNDGSICADVDTACRNVIEKCGYAKYFIHSTGHGIGLDVHEPPWLRIKNQEVLKTNMAITIEPGIYLKDKFGVRIEDSIIVNAYDNGNVMNLNTFTKDLIVLE
jgi:Xaa-Pro aminopeptidase/Xaa-Pro dipeptidase